VNALAERLGGSHGLALANYLRDSERGISASLIDLDDEDKIHYERVLRDIVGDTFAKGLPYIGVGDVSRLLAPFDGEISRASQSLNYLTTVYGELRSRPPAPTLPQQPMFIPNFIPQVIEEPSSPCGVTGCPSNDDDGGDLGSFRRMERRNREMIRNIERRRIERDEHSRTRRIVRRLKRQL